jgi:hypothetical protein
MAQSKAAQTDLKSVGWTDREMVVHMVVSTARKKEHWSVFWSDTNLVGSLEAMLAMQPVESTEYHSAESKAILRADLAVAK